MRGFNLFAAFLGVAMIAIAVGYSMYAQQEKSARSDLMVQELVRFDTAGVAEVIKSDVYNTLLAKIRQDFQEYFESTPLDPPEDVWSSEEAFVDWFEHDFARSESMTYWIADRMMSELKSIAASTMFGEEYEISVIGNTKATAGALKDAVSAKILEDGTFIYVIDTEKMPPEAYDNLPKIMVKKRGETAGFTTDVVLPRGKWTLPVPLRVTEAYRVARETREYIESTGKQKYLALAAGHCDQDNLAICDAFVLDGTKLKPMTVNESYFEDKTPVSSLENSEGPKGLIISPCKKQQIDYTKIVKETGMGWDDFTNMLKEQIQREIQYVEEALENTEDPNKVESLQKYHQELLDALEQIRSGEATEQFKSMPCEDSLEGITPILNAVSASLTKDTLVNRVADLRDSRGEALADSTDNFRILPDIESYKRYETGKVVRRTAVNVLKIICEEAGGGIVNILCMFAGIPENKCLCGQISGAAGSYGTISFDTCNISDSVYCVAPERISFVVVWSDPNENYRLDKERPATFMFRVSLGENPYKETLEALEQAAEEIKIGQSDDASVREERKEICQETVSNMASVLPQLTEGCIQQYASTLIKCSGTDEGTLNYILTGIPESLQETCAQCSGEDCPEGCRIDGDPLEGICKRLDEKKFKSIPGLYRGEGLPEFACVASTDLTEDQKNCLQQQGVYTNGETVCFGEGAANACGMGDIYRANVVESWLSTVGDDPWFCDPYVQGSLTDAIKKAVEKVMDKVNAFTQTLCQVAGVKNISDVITNCDGERSIKDIVKSFSPLGLACSNTQQYGAYRADELSAEYNYLYYEHFWPTIQEISRQGWGICSPDSPEIQALVQAFSEPKTTEQGISTGGNCHPQHILDQATQIAEMRRKSVHCDVEGPKDQTLFETTWMHIGSEIYATCSVGEPRP